MGELQLAPAFGHELGQCAEHLDRPASGTCERCGRFVCSQCERAGVGRRCAACVGQVLAGVPTSTGVARRSVWLLYANGALSIFAVLPLAVAPQASTLAFRLLALALLLLQFGLYLTTSVFFLRWLYRAVRQVQALAADVGATPGWAVGYWFLPGVNLYRPYQIVSRLAAAAGASLSSSWLGVWWALWLLSGVLGKAELRLDPSPGLLLTSALVSAGAAFLCARVVSGIEQALVERRKEYP